MSRYSGRVATDCAAALAAISHLPSALRPERPSSALSETARFCRVIEKAVGRDAGVGEKLASLLHEARSYEVAADTSPEEAARSKQIFLADCWSVRMIVERLSAA